MPAPMAITFKKITHQAVDVGQPAVVAALWSPASNTRATFTLTGEFHGIARLGGKGTGRVQPIPIDLDGGSITITFRPLGRVNKDNGLILTPTACLDGTPDRVVIRSTQDRRHGPATLSVNCPPVVSPPVIPPCNCYPPPVVPPVIPPVQQVPLSVSSIFLDAQPGPGDEEIGRFSVGSEPVTLNEMTFVDNEGGFAGMDVSTLTLRYWHESNGAYGPALGTVTIVNATTIHVTGINALVTPLDGDTQLFSLDGDILAPLLLDSVSAIGTR